MLVPSDLRNGGVQDQLPVALYRKYGRAPIILLASSNDGFRPEPPFVTRFTNGLSWSGAAAGGTDPIADGQPGLSVPRERSFVHVLPGGRNWADSRLAALKSQAADSCPPWANPRGRR